MLKGVERAMRQIKTCTEKSLCQLVAFKTKGKMNKTLIKYYGCGEVQNVTKDIPASVFYKMVLEFY